jgi:hypothetical protein
MVGIKYDTSVGSVFGRLTIIGKPESIRNIDSKNRKCYTYLVLTKCECGTIKKVNRNNLSRGLQKSCGCLVKEMTTKRMTTHGLGKHPLFRVWSDMITRCENKKSWAYCYYGGRGVTICDEWRRNFKAFYNWSIDNGWVRGLRIDKDAIPRKLGIPALLYSPKMCCFITHKENCNNRSSNHSITFNGVTKNITVWESELGFPKDLVYTRLKNGWSVEDTLTTKPGERYKWIEYNNIKLIQKEWATKLGIHPSLLGHHLKKHTFDKIYNWFKNGNNNPYGRIR